MDKLVKLSPNLPLPIRTTPDQKWMSVFDLLSWVTGVKNPHDLWDKIKEEVLALRENFSEFQFPGQGQSATPVTNPTPVS